MNNKQPVTTSTPTFSPYHSDGSDLLHNHDPRSTNSGVTANTFNPNNSSGSVHSGQPKIKKTSSGSSKPIKTPSPGGTTTDSPIHNTTSDLSSDKRGHTTDETVGNAAEKDLSGSSHLIKTHALLGPLYKAQTNNTISTHFKDWESNFSRYSSNERDFTQSKIPFRSVVPLLNNNSNVSSVFPKFVSDLVQNDATLIAKAYPAPTGPTHAAPDRVAVNLVAAKGGVSNITTPNEYRNLATDDKNEVAMEMAILYMKECYLPGQIMTIDNGTAEEQARVNAALTHLVGMKCRADRRGMDTIQTVETGDKNVENNFNTWLASNQGQYKDYFKELKKPKQTLLERLREMTKAIPDATAGQSNNLEISSGKRSWFRR